MLVCTAILCIGLCVLVAIGGGPIQGVLRSKTNTADLRSATVIDFMFGLCLLYKAFLSTFPLSTTWVFLGLLGGREIALRIKEQEFEYVATNRRIATQRCPLLKVWPCSSYQSSTNSERRRRSFGLSVQQGFSAHF